MPVEVIMPKVDMDMASGKIMCWHVAVGNRVEKGDPLFDIETDKAAMEVEAPASGILHHAAPEGAEIPIGKAVAWLYAEGEDVGEQPSSFASVGEPTAGPLPDPEAAPEALSTDADPEPETEREMAFADGAGEGIRATPAARRLARDEGVPLASLHGTGPRGRVQAFDVREYLKGLTTPSAPATFRPETGPLVVTRSKGGKGTPILMIHGFANDTTSWAPLEPSLRHRPLIRIHLPGHGRSPKLRIRDFAMLAREVRQAFDALQLDRAHLLGHSLGGALCIALADTRERQLASLNLIAPAGLGPQINGEALSGICKATRTESLKPWLRSLVANEDLITDAYARLAMQSRSDANLRAAQAAMADVLFPDGVQAFDLRAALERIRTPTRILWGKADAIIPWKHALRAPGRMALHLFDGVGHMPQFEAAEEVGNILRSHV
ncbi:acetoin dehydrogenase dihydrolipoyllysine-residue acetyltransferase subunit [Frigidibacter sp. ROC022]|uniref:acetoin dehydrogenase dihydrolipoyllysine-residue acetyltransferase subunit n=1 Tax=Frigidibacter sp. ROC022 TaxID=2971796 RepID=UPI00215AC80C|nr:acetoin dehydrogenase dihydrolipoyllysine-residue acetyltransferase subunit [Frigidibacter sp. ROC022]MCR8722758.1 acetoin dehydrogenase dihydrolipoyllysine-residue acetyltransferase subunit [Frigidibacter sp. ROC022]